MAGWTVPTFGQFFASINYVCAMSRKPSHLQRHLAATELIETKFSQDLGTVCIWSSAGQGGEAQQESNSREWSHQIEAARLGSNRGITQHRQATLLF